MLARFIQRGLSGVNTNFLGSCAKRFFGNEYSPFIPGGGLEKLQGSYKEESYFKVNDFKLMLKVREHAMRTKGYDTSEIKETIDRVNRYESVHDSHQGLMNKHKNASEELFFLTEEAENLRRLEAKMRLDLEQKMLEEIKMNSNQMMEEKYAESMETVPKMRMVPEYK